MHQPILNAILEAKQQILAALAMPGCKKAVQQLRRELLAAEHQTQVDLASQSQLIIDRTQLILDRLAGAASPIIVIAAGSTIHFPGLTPDTGDQPMPTYSLPRDHADEPFTLDPISVTDSEGDVAFTDSFESDNNDVVAIDAAASTVHFGTFGTATLSRKVTVAGNTVSVGDPSVFNLAPGALTISGGGVSFPGLTPDA